MSESEPASPRAEPVWRLLCVADEDGVRVLARKRVEMTVPPSEPLDEAPERTGFWAELRDADDRPHYRSLMEDPLEERLEVPAGPGEREFGRAAVPRRRAFTLLVPERGDADRVALVRGAAAPGVREAGEAPRVELAEVARLSMRGREGIS